MGMGTELRDRHGVGEYVVGRILPLAPVPEPVPFRGRRADGDPEALPFLEELEHGLRATPATRWTIWSPPGCGKSTLARHVAVRMGQRFLEDPDHEPIPLWFTPDERLPNISRVVERFKELHRFVKVVGCEERLAVFIPCSPCRNEVIVRMAQWDRETAFLFAQRKSGREGVARLQALEASPAPVLLEYPAYVSFVLELDELRPEEIERDGGVPRFLHALWSERAHSSGFATWCAHLLKQEPADSEERAASRCLHLVPREAGLMSDWAGAFRAFLIAETIRLDQWHGTLRDRRLTDGELSLLDRILTNKSDRDRVRWGESSRSYGAAPRPIPAWP